MMEGSNVVQFPHVRRKTSSPIMGHHVDRLIKDFTSGGKRQHEVFGRLSIFLEELEREVKQTYGERSGKLSEAYGPHYGKMKPRFSAKNGVPPKPLFCTPGGWIAVIRGFAAVLGRHEHSLLAAALERALGFAGSDETATPGDYAEVFVLLDALKEHVTALADLVAINEYVSRSGLKLHDGGIQVAEWPWNAGFIDGMIYNESAFDFVPRVFGINAAPVAEVDLLRLDLDAQEFTFLAKLAADLPHDGTITLREARLIGIGIAVTSTSCQPEIALLEWDRALATSYDANGTVLSKESVESPLGNNVDLDAGFTGVGDGYNSPPDWHPNGIRIHFRGSDGFNRALRSTLIRPLIWAELNPDLWFPDPNPDFSYYPVSAPAHTTAAAIEGNLLYAHQAGKADDRIDRLLIRSIKKIEEALAQFREQGELIRRPRQAAILSEWGLDTLTRSSPNEEAKS